MIIIIYVTVQTAGTFPEIQVSKGETGPQAGVASSVSMATKELHKRENLGAMSPPAGGVTPLFSQHIPVWN